MHNLFLFFNTQKESCDKIIYVCRLQLDKINA